MALEVKQEARLRALQCMSSKGPLAIDYPRLFQGIGWKEETDVIPEGSMIHPPGKSRIRFTKSKNIDIGLVAKPNEKQGGLIIWDENFPRALAHTLSEK